jgi:hypothetical protein
LLLLLIFCGSELAREGGLTADLFLEVLLNPIVGVSLLAMRLSLITIISIQTLLENPRKTDSPNHSITPIHWR